MIWDVAALRKLRELREQGLTASEIASHFGLKSRGAVCGALHRACIPPPAKPATREQQTESYRKRLIHNRDRMIRQRKAAKASYKPAEVVQMPDEPEPLGDTGRGCRWLHGEAADRNFCGAPGEPWCEFHEAAVFRFTPMLGKKPGLERNG